MKRKIIFFTIFILFLLPKEIVYGSQSDVFTQTINLETQEKILESLSIYNDKFKSYSKLVKENPNLKYIVYYSEKEDEILVGFYSGSYGGLSYYSNRAEMSLLANQFSGANLFSFDLKGNLITQTIKTGYIVVANKKGVFSTGVVSWNMFESYENENTKPEDGFVLPKIILDVFEKIWEFISDIGKFIHSIFVPSDKNIIVDFFSDIKNKLLSYFDPILSFLDDIKDLFTPESLVEETADNTQKRSMNNSYYQEDFYNMKWELKMGTIEPFKGLKPLGYKIYLLLNSILVVFTMASIIKRITGTGDIIE